MVSRSSIAECLPEPVLPSRRDGNRFVSAVMSQQLHSARSLPSQPCVHAPRQSCRVCARIFSSFAPFTALKALSLVTGAFSSPGLLLSGCVGFVPHLALSGVIHQAGVTGTAEGRGPGCVPTLPLSCSLCPRSSVSPLWPSCWAGDCCTFPWE